METVPGTLRQWALIADSIAALECNHEQRIKRISIMLGMVEDYMKLYRPVWHVTLINLLRQTKNKRLKLTHSEICILLNLFRDTALHVADNYDAWWLAWTQEPEAQPPKSPPKVDPFKNFLDALNEDDEDETQS